MLHSFASPQETIWIAWDVIERWINPRECRKRKASLIWSSTCKIVSMRSTGNSVRWKKTEVPILYCRSLKPEVLRNHCTPGGKESKNEMYFMVVKIISYFLVVKITNYTFWTTYTFLSIKQTTEIKEKDTDDAKIHPELESTLRISCLYLQLSHNLDVCTLRGKKKRIQLTVKK